MFETKDIIALCKSYEQELIDTKNYLHTIPEMGGMVYKTSAYAKEEMKKLGLPLTDITDVCFYATLDTGKEGPTLVMRGDMDALPMEESPLNNAGIKKQFVSGHEGFCHACGHDGHTANLIYAAKVLTSQKDKLKGGKIQFLFEAGEENGADTQEILQWVKDTKPDCLWAIHFYPNAPTGKISVQSGSRAAGIGVYKFKAVGRGGHSSRPDQSLNPLPAAAEALLAIQTLVPLKANPNEMVTFAVTGLNGGKVLNIIPDEVEVYGSYRYYQPETGKMLDEAWQKTAKAAIESAFCKYERIPLNLGLPPVVNNAEMSELARGSLLKINPDLDCDIPASAASEPMGLYMNETKGCFAWVGIGSAELGTDAVLHNAKFDVDMSMMLPTLQVSVQFAVDYLERGEK